MFFSLFFFLYILPSIATRIFTETKYPNNCNDLEDGEYTFKFINSDHSRYPLINGKCSNGYLILDYNYDNQLYNFFSSWTQWFKDTYGPTNTDNLANWDDWFLPASFILPDDQEEKLMWLVSPDCNVCNESSSFNQWFGTKSSWYMSADIYGCANHVKQLSICDFVYPDSTCDEDNDDCFRDYGECAICPNRTDSYSNVINDENRILLNEKTLTQLQNIKHFRIEELSMTGVCPSLLRRSDDHMFDLHDDCATVDTYKPSLGINGRNCQCYKTTESTEYYAASSKQIKEREEADEEQESNDELKLEKEAIKAGASIDDTYYLTNDDFTSGTYRITQSGTYILSEDITLDFNAPDDLDDIDDIFNSYKPLSTQSDEYPGAGSYKDTYFLGFFAGITVEADDVIIDLNGNSIGMSEYFYHQQRWFTLIELSKQYFLTGQGIGNFGVDPYFSDNIIIKNGKLDLTSHHSIHGNNNKNIQLLDLTIKNFETHGIGINGFENLSIKNVDLLHSSNKILFTGEFAHGIWALNKFKAAGLEAIGTDYETIKFKNRDETTTLLDIADELETKMKYAWHYVINGVTLDSSDESYDDYLDAIDLFVNSNGYISYGSTQYGIYLNGFGANLFVYSTTTYDYSGTAELVNVSISNMNHKLKEYVRLYNSATLNPYVNMFLGSLDARDFVDGIENTDFNIDDLRLENTKYSYKGNVLVDAYIVLDFICDNWNYMGQTALLRDEIGLFALDTNITYYNSALKSSHNDYPNQNFGLSCNADVMSHTPKGIIGIRLEGITNVYLNNVQITNLHDKTELGSELCGEYETFIRDRSQTETNGHIKQTSPMQVGFSGNIIQGICMNDVKNAQLNNIYIDNLKSNTGDVYGIVAWRESVITVTGDISVSNLYSGIKLEKNTLSYTDRPNHAPEVCAIKVYNAAGIDNPEGPPTLLSFDDNIDDNNIQVSCIDGHTNCMNLDESERKTRKKYVNDAGYDVNYNTKWSDVGYYTDDTSSCIDTSKYWDSSSSSSSSKSNWHIFKNIGNYIVKFLSSNTHLLILAFAALILILCFGIIMLINKRFEVKYTLLNQENDYVNGIYDTL